jgi:uncharacterized LabA/DUF88 family protein
MTKVGIFIDGGYFDEVSKYYRYNHPRSSWLNLGGLLAYAKSLVENIEGKSEERYSKTVVVTEAHFFRGKFSAESADAAGKLMDDRVFEDIIMRSGVTPHFSPLDENGPVPKEKGVDVGLALEAYDLAVQGKVDYVVLVAGDGDYAPLMRKLHARGVNTVVLVWNFHYSFIGPNGQPIEKVTNSSRALATEAMHPIDMNAIVDDRERYPKADMLFNN